MTTTRKPDQDLTEQGIVSERVFDGKLLHVRRDEVRLPDASTSVREWIDHPGAAAVVPLFANGDTLLLRQYRYPAQRHFWELPAGKLDREDEAPLALAKRELVEESGWQAKRWTELGTFYPAIGYSSERIVLFIAEELSHVGQQLDAGEFVEPWRLPFAQALDMVEKGQIQDAKTMTGILWTARKLR